MPITKKHASVKTKKTSTSKSTTPHLAAHELSISEQDLVGLHTAIENAKIATEALACNEPKKALLTEARERIFNERMGAFYVDLDDGRQLLLKPNTRRWPLNTAQATKIEEIIEDAGHDAGDYYMESHEIKIDADTAHDRLGEDEYMKFQSELGEFMSKRGLGDCWEMKESILPRTDFFESRHTLPVNINLDIEEVKPSTISVEAKRTI